MHELSIASAIVEKVLSFAEERNLARVLEVRVAIGELSHLDSEQLRFCYSSITENSPLADSTLEIEHSAAAVECSHCGYQGGPKYLESGLSAMPVPTFECPQCGKAVQPIQGQECEIKSVKVVPPAQPTVA